MLEIIKKRLSRVILTILTICVCLIMITLTYMTVSSQAKDMVNEMHYFGNRLSASIYNGMKYPMGKGDNEIVEKQLMNIRKNMDDVEVFIFDADQLITFACHEMTINSMVADHIQNPAAMQALEETLRTGIIPTKPFEGEFDGKQYLLTIFPIHNEAECFRCHGSDKKIIGGIVVKMDTDKTHTAITSQVQRDIIVSLLGIVALIGLIYTVISKLITQPLGELASDMKKLPEKIAKGENSTLTIVSRKDEIGDLITSFQNMGTDITIKTETINRANKELAEANKELESFAYSVSHDLRAPLRNIDGFSKILLEEYAEQLDDTGKHYLNRVRNGTTKMGALIDGILTFSRVGRTELQLKPISGNKLVNDALRDFSDRIVENDISIKVADLPTILCDYTLLMRVFTNLISNAIKFARDNEKLEINVGYDAEQETIFFQDNGIGFDMQYHDKVFQVFQRLHLPEEYEGTGIGLAVIKRIIERHHGSVLAESKLDQGTTFFLKLPIQKK